MPKRWLWANQEVFLFLFCFSVFPSSMQPLRNLNKWSLTFLNGSKDEIKWNYKTPYSTIFFLWLVFLFRSGGSHPSRCGLFVSWLTAGDAGVPALILTAVLSLDPWPFLTKAHGQWVPATSLMDKSLPASLVYIHIILKSSTVTFLITAKSLFREEKGRAFLLLQTLNIAQGSKSCKRVSVFPAPFSWGFPISFSYDRDTGSLAPEAAYAELEFLLSWFFRSCCYLASPGSGPNHIPKALGEVMKKGACCRPNNSLLKMCTP